MEALIGHIVTECIKSGVALRFVPSDYIDGYSGAWDDVTKTLELATGKPDWHEILAHEFGHFQQWKEGLFCGGIYEEVYNTDIHEHWLEGKVEIPDAKLREMTEAMQLCELDAEKRAYDLLHKFGLSVDQYIQKSNAYVLFYVVMEKHRRWCDGRAPSGVKAIVDLMPTTFITNLRDLPAGFEELVVEHCFLPRPTKPWWRFW